MTAWEVSLSFMVFIIVITFRFWRLDGVTFGNSHAEGYCFSHPGSYCISHGKRIQLELLGELLINRDDVGCMNVMKFRSVQPNASSVGAEDALDEKFGIALSHP